MYGTRKVKKYKYALKAQLHFLPLKKKKKSEKYENNNDNSIIIIVYMNKKGKRRRRKEEENKCSDLCVCVFVVVVELGWV